MYVSALEGRMFSMFRYQRMVGTLPRWFFPWSSLPYPMDLGEKIGYQWVETSCLFLVCNCHPSIFMSSISFTYHDKPICTWFSLISWHCTTILFLKTYEFLDFPCPGYQIKGSTHLWPSSHCKSRCQVGVVEVFGGNQLHNSLQTTTSHQHLQAALRRVAEVWDESSHLAGGYIVRIRTAKVMAVSWGTCGKMVGHQ